MSGLNDKERSVVQKVLGTQCKVHSIAVVRFYRCYAETDYWDTNHMMGAAIVLSEPSLGSYYLRLIDLKSDGIVFEQEFYQKNGVL